MKPEEFAKTAKKSFWNSWNSRKKEMPVSGISFFCCAGIKKWN